MPQRLFIAIDLPADIRQRLRHLLPDPRDGVKPVRPEHLHLTLHFLGEVEDGQAAWLAAALDEISQPAFTIALAVGGCFPSARRPAVLWIGIEPSAPLQALHAAVARVLAEGGFVIESRPFTPHITLARVSRRLPSGWLDEFLETVRSLSGREVPVAAFTLFASERTSDGAMHTPLRTYPLTKNGRSPSY